MPGPASFLFFVRFQTQLSQQLTKSQKVKRWIAWCCLAMLLLLVCAPWLIASSPLRDYGLNFLFQDPDLKISSETASLGWLSPAELSNVAVLSTDQRVKISVKHVATQKTFSGLLFNNQELGQVDVEQARVHLKLPLETPTQASHEKLLYFTARLKDADLLVEYEGDAEPIVNLSHLNLAIQLKHEAAGDFLTVGEFTLYERQELTAELCDEFLQLIDPVLADVAKVRGSLSCHFDTISIPLNVMDEAAAVHDLKLKGTLTIHDLTGEFQTPLLRDMMRIIADMHDVELPKVIRLVEDTTIDFEVREGRIYHSGLRFGLPDISPDLMVSSAGSVGIDESLDLVIEVPRVLVGDEKEAKAEQAKPVRLRVSGTILEPVVTEISE